MTNYTKTTDFAAKDALPSGNSAKIVKGSEIDTEFNNIATASATKANANDAALTGTTTFETISDGTIAITAFVDEDNMASDSATLVPTQQSVKAYVDSQVTAQDLDFQADSGGALSIDLDSETLTFTGGTGIDTSGALNAVTFAIDSTVATLTGTQTLTNKTLTSPTLNTPTIGTSFTIGSATITEAELEILDGATVTTAELNVLDGITSTTAELNILDGVTSTATELNLLDGVTATTAELNYVDGVTSNIQTQLDAKAPTASPTFTGTVTVPGLTTTADVSFGDNDKAIFGAGSDLQIYHDGSHSYVSDQGTGNLRVLAENFQVRNPANNEAMIIAIPDSGVTLYHDNSAKLATTSTGIDVTGTVTADGLTVDGVSTVRAGDTTNASLQSTAGDLVLKAGADDVILQTGGSGGESIQFVDNAGTLYFNADMETGDISFYEDTGTTAKFAWSAANERLVLSTSGAYALDVRASGTSSATMAQFSNSNGSDKAAIRLDANGDGELVLIDAGNNEDVVITAGGDSYFNGGSVGIGTSSITSGRLQVMGGTSGFDQISLSSNVTNNTTKYSGIVMTNYGNTTTALLGGKAENGTTSIYYGSSGSDHRGPQNHIFYTNASATATSGNTERLRIDSSGNVKIGTGTDRSSFLTASTANLQIDGGVVFDAGSGNNAEIFNYRTTAMLFGNGGSEDMRISGGGDWVVSNTVANVASGYSTQGGCGWVESDNHFEIATTSNRSSLEIGRNNANSGDIITFRKQSTPVGSIGNRFGAMYVHSPDGTNGAGLRFFDGVIQPCESNGNDSDNDTDLGQTNSRFKDLYLSGVAKVDSYVSLGNNGYIRGDASGELRFQGGSTATTFYNSDNTAERARIDSSGNLLVGKTSTGIATVGTQIESAGGVHSTAASERAFIGNRTTTDGSIIELRKDNATVGSIGTVGGQTFIDLKPGSGGAGFRGGNAKIVPYVNSADADDTVDIGATSVRFKDIYATNGTIQTSDRNEKQDIEALSDAEQRVAVAAKGLLRKFRWISSVEENGDEARIHFGIIAQDLQAAFEAEGLDAGRYGMFINTTWTDEETGEERSRMGVRYSELLAFIIAAI